MDFSKHSPIAHATERAPVQRTRLPNGDVLTEKIPPQPYSRKMVTPSGTVVRVPLATGRTIGREVTNSYGIQKLEEKKLRGLLLYAECPYANGWLPRAPGITPCEGNGDGGSGTFWRRHPNNSNAYVEDQCCEHIQEIIDRRTKAHTAKQADYAEQYRTAQDRLADLELEKLQMAKASQQKVRGSSSDETSFAGVPEADVLD